MLSPATAEVASLLQAAHERGYIGEPISQLEHALQCAHLAKECGGSAALIIAALLHDIGHFCQETIAVPSPELRPDNKFGRDDHPLIAASWLAARGFSLQVTALVAGHVDAKRYLVAKNPGYCQSLSEASQETLKQQGGPMSRAEMRHFADHPFFKDLLALRSFDDRAKLTVWQGPDLASYYSLIETQVNAAHCP